MKWCPHHSCHYVGMGNAFPIPIPIDCLVQLLEDPEFLDIILDDDDLEDDLQPVREDLRDFRRKQFSNRRAAPRQRDRAYALREMSQLSEFQFQRMRMFSPLTAGET